MTKLVNGDIFDEKFRNSQTCIVHQCNCVAIIPHGLSKEIVENFGKYANGYKERKPLSKNIAMVCDRPQPGSIMFSEGSPNVIALFSQFLFGRSSSLSRYKFNDDHINKGISKDTKKDRLLYFEQALTNLVIQLVKYNNNNNNNTIDTILFPYKIGCGLAGGNWRKYKKKIRNFDRKLKEKDENRKYNVLIVKKKK